MKSHQCYLSNNSQIHLSVPSSSLLPYSNPCHLLPESRPFSPTLLPVFFPLNIPLYSPQPWNDYLHIQHNMQHTPFMIWLLFHPHLPTCLPNILSSRKPNYLQFSQGPMLLEVPMPLCVQFPRSRMPSSNIVWILSDSSFKIQLKYHLFCEVFPDYHCII